MPDLIEPARAELRSVGIPFEHLCVVSGALDDVERALGAHLRPGDRVAVEDPGYANAFDLLRALGLTTVPVADETAAAQGLLEAGWAVMNGAPCRIQSAPAIRITASTLTSGEAGR